MTALHCLECRDPLRLGQTLGQESAAMDGLVSTGLSLKQLSLFCKSLQFQCTALHLNQYYRNQLAHCLHERFNSYKLAEL